MLPFQAGYSFQAAANSTLIVSRGADLRNALARRLRRSAQARVDQPACRHMARTRFSKPRCAPSNRGSGGLLESQSIPWLACKLLNIMSDNV